MEIKVEFSDIDSLNEELKFVVIQARYQGKWVLVRHQSRTTWEIAGGHIEKGEGPDEAAKRELYEETGAIKFELIPISEYTVIRQQTERSSGRLYYATIEELGALGEYEIEEVKLFDEMPGHMTYKEIQPHLFKKVIETVG